MTNLRLDRLATRRDHFLAAGKVLLIAAVLLWCLLMAFFDIAIDRPGMRDILLNTRSSYFLLYTKIAPLDHRSIWGGPATLFGLRCLAGTLGSIALIALFRERMNSGKISRLGICLIITAVAAGSAATAADSPGIFPTYVSADDFDKMLAAVDAREPGLVARLRAGERPDLPREAGGETRSLQRVAASGRWVAAADEPVLHDQADAEGLRFALAQQAYLSGNREALQRLLPIALVAAPTDEPARYDIARRLALLGQGAGESATPSGNAFPVAAYSATWHVRVSWIHWLRRLMQIVLFSGLAASAIGLLMRRRYAAIDDLQREVGSNERG